MDNRAFTFLETTVTLAVIAVLIGVVGIRYRNAKQAAYMTHIQAELRDLMTAQEAYYGTGSLGGGEPRYAESVEQLGFVPRKGVTIELRGDTNGWTARANSVELPDDYSCALFIGDIEPLAPAEVEGVMECVPRKRKLL